MRRTMLKAIVKAEAAIRPPLFFVKYSSIFLPISLSRFITGVGGISEGVFISSYEGCDCIHGLIVRALHERQLIGPKVAQHIVLRLASNRASDSEPQASKVLVAQSIDDRAHSFVPTRAALLTQPNPA